MIFRRKPSRGLHTITVIESESLNYLLGPLLADVLLRPFFDCVSDPQLQVPRIERKVVSRALREWEACRTSPHAGQILVVDELLEHLRGNSKGEDTPGFRAELVRQSLHHLRGTPLDQIPEMSDGMGP